MPRALGLLAALCLMHARAGSVSAALLYPEMSNGTFHHYFVPDGYYEENDDPERCQTLFRVTDETRCGPDEDRDSVIRDDFTILRRQVEDAARVLEGVGRSASVDLEGEQSYGEFLRREGSQVAEAFAAAGKSLLELEVKLGQSQEREAESREARRAGERLLAMTGSARNSARETLDVALALRDRHELLSLIIRSHGTRLSRLKNEFLKV